MNKFFNVLVQISVVIIALIFAVISWNIFLFNFEGLGLCVCCLEFIFSYAIILDFIDIIFSKQKYNSLKYLENV